MKYGANGAAYSLRSKRARAGKQAPAGVMAMRLVFFRFAQTAPHDLAGDG